MSAVPSVVTFEADQSPPTVVTVTGADGVKYEVKLASVVTSVVDTGIRNPLDDVPIFSIQTQTVVQVKRKPDG
jgi:hypothetical protein